MVEGFSDFLERNENHTRRFENEQFDAVQTGQSPEFVTVCCSDSRVLQDEMCENSSPGHVFTCGNIGNRVVENTAEGTRVSGDVLYPIAHTGTASVVVIGHTGCGAVTATYEDVTEGIEEPAGIRHCVDLLKTQLTDGIEMLPDDLDDSEAINRLVEYNVDRQVEFLLNSDDVGSEVDVLGAVYDFQDVYSNERGLLHVVNVNGAIEREQIEGKNPELTKRMNRLWTY